MTRLWLPIVISCALGSAPAARIQNADVTSLVEQIRQASKTQLPDWTFEKGGEGSSRTGDFFLAWKRNGDHLDASCDAYDSPVEARHELGSLRMGISAGVPKPLPGVADEAYFLGPYGTKGTWHTYFARGRFVCQLGSGPQAETRTLTQIVIQAIDKAK